MLNNRSSEKEIIDLGPQHYTVEEYRDCLKKLFWINRLLGFTSSTVRLLFKKFPSAKTLLDVGCGGGSFLLHLNRFFPQIKMTGIDINPEAIQECEKRLALKKKINPRIQINFQLQPEPKFNFNENSFDIVVATLVCHHLTDQELIEFFRAAIKVAKKAVIIHDLHRHRFAMIIYRLFAPLLFRNRLITHDGLISIRRSFIRSEWKKLLEKAEIKNYQIKWYFPFRWRVILKKES